MDILTRLDACAECEQAPLAPLLTDAAAEIRKLHKDAERYRWLRKHVTDAHSIYRDVNGYLQSFEFDCEGDVELDAAIDAAMAGREAASHGTNGTAATVSGLPTSNLTAKFSGDAKRHPLQREVRALRDNKGDDMKQQVMQTVHVCDKCASPQTYAFDACISCGVEHCYQCKKTEGSEYAHGVNVFGSGDGYYCNACDARLTKEGDDKRHELYRRIKSLRDEGRAWTEDYRRRCDLAEKQLAALRPNSQDNPRPEGASD